ncbi:hypothetical protein C8A05DRAFT_38799 [Staphylotrichum tortipilum]|uniref:Uncharacterized protein n=1 Tax=Staphylotrichum tortipilum TaxID=2831512 RepID=A0AAN6MCV7_9PEZI|nr:hypothetical protein C8A05DRAFT_38799 [Staphylotrichum longicolle]
MTAAEKINAGTAAMDEAAKAAAAGQEEAQSQDGNQGQGRDQSDCDGPYICDCRLCICGRAVEFPGDMCFECSKTH